MLNKPEYEFLKTDKHLGNNICLLTYGGSIAYGTNLPTSDIDIRGIAINTKEELLTGNCFEQVIDEKTDTTIYSINKIFKLLSNCNPNVIELLGCKEYLLLNDIGKLLLDNRHLFLSKRAIYTFGGYATSQLRRLENKTFDNISQSKQEEYILRSLFNSNEDFSSKYNITGFNCYIDKSLKEEYDTEIYIDWDIKHIPIRDIQDYFNTASQVIKSYNSVGKRNESALSKNKIAKHSMHLVRLLYMLLDILYKGEIITYRENEHDLLMDIRNGKYLDEKGIPNKEFYEILNELENKVEYAKTDKAVVVPDKVDMTKISELLYDINYRSLEL